MTGEQGSISLAMQGIAASVETTSQALDPKYSRSYFAEIIDLVPPCGTLTLERLGEMTKEEGLPFHTRIYAATLHKFLTEPSVMKSLIGNEFINGLVEDGLDRYEMAIMLSRFNQQQATAMPADISPVFDADVKAFEHDERVVLDDETKRGLAAAEGSFIKVGQQVKEAVAGLSKSLSIKEPEADGNLASRAARGVQSTLDQTTKALEIPEQVMKFIRPPKPHPDGDIMAAFKRWDEMRRMGLDLATQDPDDSVKPEDFGGKWKALETIDEVRAMFVRVGSKIGVSEFVIDAIFEDGSLSEGEFKQIIDYVETNASNVDLQSLTDDERNDFNAVTGTIATSIMFGAFGKHGPLIKGDDVKHPRAESVDSGIFRDFGSGKNPDPGIVRPSEPGPNPDPGITRPLPGMGLSRPPGGGAF